MSEKYRVRRDDIVSAMLNQLTNKQVEQILEEYRVNRDRYPEEWSSKKILSFIYRKGWIDTDEYL